MEHRSLRFTLSILLAAFLLFMFSIYNSVNAQPHSTTLTVEVPSATQGKATTLRAALKDENGNPIQGLSIQFQVDDGTGWSDVESADTDSNGVASISYTFLHAQTYRVRAVFGGTTDYSQSTSPIGSVDVYVDYTQNAIIIAVAIIAVCIVGYIVYRKRK